MGKDILSFDGKRLAIFSEGGIRIDTTLPKYKTNEGNKTDMSERIAEKSASNLAPLIGRDVSANDFNIGMTYIMRNGVKNMSTPDRIDIGSSSSFVVHGKYRRNSVFRKMKEWFARHRDRNDEQRKIDIIKFFSAIKSSLSDTEATKYTERVSDYMAYMAFVEHAGQVALKEKLFNDIAIMKMESLLYAKGFHVAIDEDTVVKFAEQSERGVCLDYIANYVRNIPIEVVKKKIVADSVMVFDNYVIMHYDPDDGNTDMTQEEKEEDIRRKSDPILFGVISGSRKLYYVADWVDDVCDLTMDKIVETVGRDLVDNGHIKSSWS